MSTCCCPPLLSPVPLTSLLLFALLILGACRGPSRGAARTRQEPHARQVPRSGKVPRARRLQPGAGRGLHAGAARQVPHPRGPGHLRRRPPSGQVPHPRGPRRRGRCRRGGGGRASSSARVWSGGKVGECGGLCFPKQLRRATKGDGRSEATHTCYFFKTSFLSITPTRVCPFCFWCMRRVFPPVHVDKLKL